MSDPARRAPAGGIRRLIGLILVVISTLWLVLTGLCSAAFAIGLMGEGNLNDLGGVLAIGLPSALIGAMIYAVGRLLRPKA